MGVKICSTLWNMWMALIFNHRRKKWMTGSSQLANSTFEKTYCFSSFGKKILLRVKLGDFPPGFYFLTDVAISNFRTNHCSCCFSHKFDSPLHSLTVVRKDGQSLLKSWISLVYFNESFISQYKSVRRYRWNFSSFYRTLSPTSFILGNGKN